MAGMARAPSSPPLRRRFVRPLKITIHKEQRLSESRCGAVSSVDGSSARAGRDVLRAARVSDDLRESQERMALATHAVNLGFGFPISCGTKFGLPISGGSCWVLRNLSGLISIASYESCTPRIAKQSARPLRRRSVRPAATLRRWSNDWKRDAVNWPEPPTVERVERIARAALRAHEERVYAESTGDCRRRCASVLTSCWALPRVKPIVQ
jgi:hypothetical protein